MITNPSQSAPEWAALFSRFRNCSVLVVGDMMLDHFIWGTVKRISPEAPVPVVEVDRESSQPGGASNVVNNIGALGARTSVVGVVGKDRDGDTLCDCLASAGVDISGVVRDPHRHTTIKTRVVAHSQQLVRVDRESADPLSPEVYADLEASAVRLACQVDAVVFSDYDKGVLSNGLVDAVRVATGARGIPVVANPKPRNLGVFTGITAVSVNQLEAEQSIGSPITNETDLARAGRSLLERLGSRHILITLGGRGLALFSNDGSWRRVPAVEVPVYDVAGAGDTVISAFTLALCSGADPGTAAELANLAAGAVVRKVGVATATPEEILALHHGA